LKTFAIFSFIAIALIILGSTNVSADETTLTTHWKVYAWIGQNYVDGVMTMNVTGTKVVGKFRDNSITGNLVDQGAQLNGDWTGPRGNGWITLNFHNDGQGFGGEWGQKGKPADGKFVGSLIAPSPAPSP
jgi:hypothetical protein